jgi:hypothetical protein
MYSVRSTKYIVYSILYLVAVFIISAGVLALLNGGIAVLVWLIASGTLSAEKFSFIMGLSSAILLIPFVSSMLIAFTESVYYSGNFSGYVDAVLKKHRTLYLKFLIISFVMVVLTNVVLYLTSLITISVVVFIIRIIFFVLIIGGGLYLSLRIRRVQIDNDSMEVSL